MSRFQAGAPHFASRLSYSAVVIVAMPQCLELTGCVYVRWSRAVQVPEARSVVCQA